jgi:hypothetical protein
MGLLFSNQAISYFFYVLRQFKIVKRNPPAREKNKQAVKNKIASACCMDIKHSKILSISYINKRNTQQSVK